MKFEIAWDRFRLKLGQRTHVMGVLNVTPDSFSDGGKYLNYDEALKRAKQLVAEGADILDIGGESTRPYSDPVPADEEIQRVVPIIKAIVPEIDIPVSIDTCKASVASAAIAAGASIVNDVSALRSDPQLAQVVADHGVPLILMHMKGTPKDMQVAPVYHDLMREIRQFLSQALQRAVACGIEKQKLIIDPGIGFGKTFEQNFSILKHLHLLTDLDTPVLVGASRKAFIRNSLKSEAYCDLTPDAPIFDIGTQAAVAATVLNGGHIVRCHNVAMAKTSVKILDAIHHAD